MSTPTVRRIKERGGSGGAKITAPPLSAGKENAISLRSRSYVAAPAQKPAVQKMPRFTRSSSAAPKGRSSSPFESTRVLSEMRKNHRVSENVKSERSASNGRRSVSGGRVFERCQPKIGSLRDLDSRSGDRAKRVHSGVKENGRIEVGLEKSGEICKKNESVLCMSQQKNGVLRDSNVKLSERVEKISRGVKEKGSLGRSEVDLEKSVETCKKSESILSGSGDLASRVSGRPQQKDESLKDSIVKLGEKVDAGIKKSGEFCTKNESGFIVSDELPVRGLKERNNIASGSGSKACVIDEGKSEDGLSSNLSKSRPSSSDSDVKRRNYRNIASIEREKSVNCNKYSGAQGTNSLRVSERLKRKGLVEVNVSGRSVNRYPSKLHEKLAFLEGKVKRIASDIKRTKEMLDMNNPDSSKVILSDIQEKISGIEKAMGNVAKGDKQVNGSEKVETKEKISANEKVMGNVINGDEQNNASEKTERKDLENVKSYVKGSKQTNVFEKVETNENILGNEKVMGSVGNADEQNNVIEKVERKELENAKSSVKGLNSEELEARLFPHHKLLRDRTSLKGSSTTSEKLDLDTKLEGKLLSHVDANPVEEDFLASLSKDQNKVTVRGENIGAEFNGVQETGGATTSKSQDSMIEVGKDDNNIILTTDETLDDFDDRKIKSLMVIDEEIDDSCIYQFNEIGHKTATGGWFVADGEAALLAHDDGSCSYYDVANSEVKSEYKPPVGILPNMWRDCWIVRAPGAEGSSGRYVVAASAGNTLESGFCSWDFYVKDIQAFHMEDGTTNSTRTALAPLPNNPSYRRNSFSNIIASENQQRWYRPSGPLITSTATNQKGVSVYDIRDGEQVMKWEVQKPVLSMDYSSPLQWRNRGKVVIAESDSVSVWDVNSQTPQALQSISTSGRQVHALHVNNTDAEHGGGVRQRVSSSEAEGNDGVFCTADSINVLDFRHPTGIGLKISKIGISTQSVFSRGDSIFLGCTNARSAGKIQPGPEIQHFSLRKQKLLSTYLFPDSNAHPHYTAITQVWGNSEFVMGVCGLGLFVFDALKDDGVHLFSTEYCSMQKVRETLGPNDLYSPSFDYLSSRVLLISRDRPALWRYLS